MIQNAPFWQQKGCSFLSRKWSFSPTEIGWNACSAFWIPWWRIANWIRTIFTMLPQPGDCLKPTNWRLFAIFSVCCWFDCTFLGEGTACRPLWFSTRSWYWWVVGLKYVCGKTLAWESGLWFARFDLRKKFDRIARHALFPALEARVPDAYVQLRRRLYAHGTGHIRSSNRRLTLCLTSSVAWNRVMSLALHCSTLG